MIKLPGLVRRRNGTYGLPARVLNSKGRATYNGIQYARIGDKWRLVKQLEDPMDPQHQEYKMRLVASAGKKRVNRRARNQKQKQD